MRLVKEEEYGGRSLGGVRGVKMRESYLKEANDWFPFHHLLIHRYIVEVGLCLKFQGGRRFL